MYSCIFCSARNRFEFINVRTQPIGKGIFFVTNVFSRLNIKKVSFNVNLADYQIENKNNESRNLNKYRTYSTFVCLSFFTFNRILNETSFFGKTIMIDGAEVVNLVHTFIYPVYRKL